MLRNCALTGVLSRVNLTTVVAVIASVIKEGDNRNGYNSWTLPTCPRPFGNLTAAQQIRCSNVFHFQNLSRPPATRE